MWSMAPSSAPRDRYYTPGRVWRLLQDFRSLLDPHRPYEDSDLLLPRNRNRPKHARFEDAVCKHADIASAIEQLPWFERLCVYRHVVVGDDLKHVATILGCDEQTVKRTVNRAVREMALSLGWEDPKRGGQGSSPLVWRHPSLDQPA
jgi:DNA-directed RNA polymerase specialized sigma24 family protein